MDIQKLWEFLAKKENIFQVSLAFIGIVTSAVFSLIDKKGLSYFSIAFVVVIVSWSAISYYLKQRGLSKLFLEQCKVSDAWTDLTKEFFIVSSNFQRYSNFVEQVSRTAKDFILWTTNTSPLDVLPQSEKKPGVIGYDEITKLTSYDEAFEKFEPEKKVRLVIFSDVDKARKYKDNIVPAEGLTRKKAFERSHNGRKVHLLFTTRDLLFHHFEIPLEDQKEVLYDMGCIYTAGVQTNELMFYSEHLTVNGEVDNETGNQKGEHVHKKTIFVLTGFNDRHKNKELYNEKFWLIFKFHKSLVEDLFKYDPSKDKDHPYVSNNILNVISSSINITPTAVSTNEQSSSDDSDNRVGLPIKNIEHNASSSISIKKNQELNHGRIKSE